MKFKKLILPVIYLVIGIGVITGIFEPYASFPKKEETIIIDAKLSFDKAEDENSTFSLYFRETSYLICETIWFPSENLINFLKNNKRTVIKARILREPSNDTKNCIKLYSLSLENEDIFYFEDALKGRRKVIMFFKFCGFILFLFGMYDFKKQLKNNNN